MRSIIHALMGGHTAEFPCQKKLDAEFAHIEELEKQRQELIEERNALLAKFQNLAELHRNDMIAIHDEYREEIALLKSNNALLREKLESINH
jgi:molecular chaperone GrpE (heat shock protein)